MVRRIMIRPLTLLLLLSILLLSCEKIDHTIMNITRFKFLESINHNNFEEAASLFHYTNNSSNTQFLNNKKRVSRCLELMINAIRNDQVKISPDYNKYKISLFSTDTLFYKNHHGLFEVYIPSQAGYENSMFFGLALLRESWKKFSIVKFSIEANSIEEGLRKNLLEEGCTVKYNPTRKEKLVAIYGNFYATILNIVTKYDPLQKENYEEEAMDIVGNIHNYKAKEELNRFIIEEFTNIEQGIIIVPENKCNIITDEIWDQYLRYLEARVKK